MYHPYPSIYTIHNKLREMVVRRAIIIHTSADDEAIKQRACTRAENPHIMVAHATPQTQVSAKSSSTCNSGDERSCEHIFLTSFRISFKWTRASVQASGKHTRRKKKCAKRTHHRSARTRNAHAKWKLHGGACARDCSSRGVCEHLLRVCVHM